MATRTRAKNSAYPVVLTFQTTVTQEERLQRARATKAVNMSQFIRAAVDRALNELEGNQPQKDHDDAQPQRRFAYGGSR